MKELIAKSIFLLLRMDVGDSINIDDNHNHVVSSDGTKIGIYLGGLSEGVLTAIPFNKKEQYRWMIILIPDKSGDNLILIKRSDYEQYRSIDYLKNKIKWKGQIESSQLQNWLTEQKKRQTKQVA